MKIEILEKLFQRKKATPNSLNVEKALSLLFEESHWRRLAWHYFFILQGENRKEHLDAARTKIIECRRKYRQLIKPEKTL